MLLHYTSSKEQQNCDARIIILLYVLTYFIFCSSTDSYLAFHFYSSHFFMTFNYPDSFTNTSHVQPHLNNIGVIERLKQCITFYQIILLRQSRKVCSVFNLKIKESSISNNCLCFRSSRFSSWLLVSYDQPQSRWLSGTARVPRGCSRSFC